MYKSEIEQWKVLTECVCSSRFCWQQERMLTLKMRMAIRHLYMRSEVTILRSWSACMTLDVPQKLQR